MSTDTNISAADIAAIFTDTNTSAAGVASISTDANTSGAAEQAVRDFPLPAGTSMLKVWKDYVSGTIERIKQAQYIKHLENRLLELEVINGEYEKRVKHKKVAATFLRYTKESEAYKVLGIKENSTDKELTDQLESKFKFSRGMFVPVLIGADEVGAICCIAKTRSHVQYLRSVLASFIRRELETYILELGFPDVMKFTSPEFDAPIVKPITFNKVTIQDAYKILEITEKATEIEIAKIVSPLSPLHTFSPEKQGAILSVWAKLPQPNCLQYLKNSILTTEATAYFDIVIPKSSVPLSKITDDTTYRIPQSIAEVTSLVDVYRILGVSNKATFKEIDEAYDGDFAQQKLPRGAIVYLSENPPNRFSSKEVATLKLYALSAILQELSSYLMNLKGIPRACVEFYQKEIRLIESLGMPSEQYIKQSVTMRKDIELYKGRCNELSVKSHLHEAAFNAMKGTLEKTKQDLRTSEKALKVKEGGLLASRESVKDLEKRLAKWVKNGEISSRRIEELELELEGKKLEIEKLRVDARVLSEEFKNRERDLELNISRLEADLSSCRTQAGVRIDLLESSLEKEKEKVGKLEEENEVTEGEMKKLKLLVEETKAQAEISSASESSHADSSTRNDRSDFLLRTLGSQLKSANEQLTIKTNENLELLMRLSGIED